MKFTSVLLLLVGAAALAGCSTTANNAAGNGTPADIRGTNTNTGYVANTEPAVKPTMPANVTNISPPSMNKVMGNSNANHNSNANASSKPVKK